ncbi:DUF3298 domain-containing protein [Clostridiales bacterium TF09-2AC]|nr:DUF3298 domain-containing protein [Clostridiales bacterium TF09-2AC]
MKKLIRILSATVGISIMFTMNSFAGTWRKRDNKESDMYTWRYMNSNSIQPEGWKWIDGNKDGIYECYYIKDEIMQENIRIDGRDINGDGQWTVKGVIQQRTLPDWIKIRPKEKTNLDGSLYYPEVSYLQKRECVSKTNDIISKYIDDVIKKNTEDMKVNEVEYDFILNDEDISRQKYISLTFDNLLYHDKATHNYNIHAYYTITPDKGILKISDIGGKQLKDDIVASVKRTLKARKDSHEGIISADPESINISFDKDWLLLEDGIHILFEETTIAPYAAGAIDIIVPYDEVKDSLNSYGKGLIDSN